MIILAVTGFQLVTTVVLMLQEHLRVRVWTALGQARHARDRTAEMADSRRPGRMLAPVRTTTLAASHAPLPGRWLDELSWKLQKRQRLFSSE